MKNFRLVPQASAVYLICYIFLCGPPKSYKQKVQTKGRMIISRRQGVLLYAPLMALAIIFGCGPSAITRVTTTSPVNGLLVQVRELDASGADVRNYSQPVQPYGLQTTEAIVEALQEAGVTAEIAKGDVPLRGQIIVEGNITRKSCKDCSIKDSSRGKSMSKSELQFCGDCNCFALPTAAGASLRLVFRRYWSGFCDFL